MVFGTPKKAPKGEAGLPPPPPVIPWRVPPMGSLGDAWDEHIVLPEAPASSPSPSPRHKKRKRRSVGLEVQFLDWEPPLHVAVIAAWAVMAMALMTTGPAYPLMPYVALLGLLLAMLAVFLLRTTHRDCSGERAGWVAIGVGLVLIAVDTADPAFRPYQVYFTRTLAVPVKARSLDDRLEQARADMELIARVTQCAYSIQDRDTVAEGRESVNGLLPGDSVSFRISTLRRVDLRTLSDIERDFVYYDRDNLPKDLFSDHPQAIYGVFVTAEHIMVYSPGPDGVWQINPLNPGVDGGGDPLVQLAEYLYSPGTGPKGSGDLIYVLRLREPEEIGYGGFTSGGFIPTDHCDATKEALLKRTW